MTDHDDDIRLAAELRAALEQRDRVVRAPRFASLWAKQSEAHWTTRAWRPLTASAAGAIVIAALIWTRTDSPTPIDPALAHRLSSADYWRVPTDAVLAYEAAPLRADLPSPTRPDFSLEESLL
jgi:hypothetical protein